MVNYTNYILIKSPGITALESLSCGLRALYTVLFFFWERLYCRLLQNRLPKNPEKR